MRLGVIGSKQLVFILFGFVFFGIFLLQNFLNHLKNPNGSLVVERSFINTSNYLLNRTNVTDQLNSTVTELNVTYPKRTDTWFFKNQAIFMLNNAFRPYDNKLFPGEDPSSDRLINQLLYRPFNYTPENIPKERYATIHISGGVNSKYELGVKSFEHCPVSTCSITNDYGADLIITKDVNFRRKKHFPEQLYMIYALESPLNNGKAGGNFDLTATYRTDSDVYSPYGKWEYYDNRVKFKTQQRNYATGKTKKVAWFVTNCHTENNRLDFAKQLQKYISVDIYGRCGNLSCAKSKAEYCDSLLREQYKFYLSFENSNCQDYITEKFFENALGNDIIPIVMGGRPQDYHKLAPYHSFIHVDEFASVEHLANYLHLLDQDDELYNSYFQWRGTGEFINTHFWCRVCAIMHTLDRDRRYWSLYEKKFSLWWEGPGVCRSTSWRTFI